MADRPQTPPDDKQRTGRMEPPAMRENKPHPNQGRPSTSTGDSTRTTDAETGLGAENKGQKSNALRMVMYAVLAVVVVLIVVGLFA